MKITYEKRKFFEEELKKGTEITEISRLTNVTRDCWYQEMRRSGMTRETYNADKAQELSNGRRHKCDTQN